MSDGEGSKFEELFRAIFFLSPIETSSTPGPVSEKYVAFKKALKDAIENLPFREREVIKCRYGIGDGHRYTPGEVAKIFHVPLHTAREIEAKAIRRLQHQIRAAVKPRTD